MPFDTLGQPLYFQNLIAGFATGCEENTRIATGRGSNLFDIELLKHLLATRRLLTFSYVRTEAADKLFQLLALLFGLLVLLLLLAQSELAGFVPEAVVAAELLYLAEVDVHRMGTDRIEEVAVVAYDEHGVFEVAQIVFQP